MSNFTTKSIEISMNHFIEKIVGGTVSFYQGGSKRPAYVGHPLTQGILEVLTFDLANSAAVMNYISGYLQIQLGAQTYSYDNYSVPNFYRIYTSAGEAVYQGLANAHGRGGTSSGHVTLVSKMLHDEYGSVATVREYTLLPPNYKCSLTNFVIQII